MSALIELARRFSRSLDKGKGITLKVADLDLLATIGVNELLQAEAAKAARVAAMVRNALRDGTNVPSSPDNSSADLIVIAPQADADVPDVMRRGRASSKRHPDFLSVPAPPLDRASIAALTSGK